MTDEEYMKIAIDLSAKAQFPFGAIVVDGDGRIIGRSDGVVKESGLKLYTHSEYRAIQDAINSGFAGDRVGGLYGGMENCTLYTSCQPCMICAGVILYKGIKRVVYGATLKDSSKYVVKEIETDTQKLAEISDVDIEIVPNVCREEAVEVLKEWHKNNAGKY